MKLEIYKFNYGSCVEYMVYLNDILMGNNTEEISNDCSLTVNKDTIIEDMDKSFINIILNNLANNMDEAISRIINADSHRYFLPHGNCIYSSCSDKVLKELDIKLKMKEIEGDFK